MLVLNSGPPDSSSWVLKLQICTLKLGCMKLVCDITVWAYFKEFRRYQILFLSSSTRILGRKVAFLV